MSLHNGCNHISIARLEALTSVRQGPARDGEVARPPVAEAAASVGQGGPRTLICIELLFAFR